MRNETRVRLDQVHPRCFICGCISLASVHRHEHGETRQGANSGKRCILGRKSDQLVNSSRDAAGYNSCLRKHTRKMMIYHSNCHLCHRSPTSTSSSRAFRDIYIFSWAIIASSLTHQYFFSRGDVLFASRRRWCRRATTNGWPRKSYLSPPFICQATPLISLLIMFDEMLK